MNENTPTPIIIVGILGIIVVIAGIAGAVLVLNNEKSSTPNTINQNSNNTSSTSQNEDTTQDVSNPGVFTDYNRSLVTDDKTTILFFAADWCPTCQTLKRNLNSTLNQIPTSVQILEVPYDDVSGATAEHLELKSRYGIDYQHYLVLIDENFNLIKKWYGSPDLQDILNNAGLN